MCSEIMYKFISFNLKNIIREREEGERKKRVIEEEKERENRGEIEVQLETYIIHYQVQYLQVCHLLKFRQAQVSINVTLFNTISTRINKIIH